MFGRIFLFFSLFFSLFYSVFASDTELVNNVWYFFWVTKTFSTGASIDQVKQSILYADNNQGWYPDRRWYNTLSWSYGMYGFPTYLDFLTTIIYTRPQNKYTFVSPYSRITLFMAKDSDWYIQYYRTKNVTDDLPHTGTGVWVWDPNSYWNLTLARFTFWPSWSELAIPRAFPVRFVESGHVEYGVAIVAYNASAWYSASPYMYFIPDIWSYSYNEDSSYILKNNIFSSISYSNYNTKIKVSGTYTRIGWYWGNFTSDYYFMDCNWDYSICYNPYANWLNEIQTDTSYPYGITVSDADINGNNPTTDIWGVTDSNYCKTSNWYDIVSFYNSANRQSVSYTFDKIGHSGESTVTSQYCLTDFYPYAWGVLASSTKLNDSGISFNGGANFIYINSWSYLYWSWTSQIRLKTNSEFDPIPDWGWGGGGGGGWTVGGGGWTVDNGYSPWLNGYDCKPVYFSSGSSDGIHIDIPTDEYIYSTGVTSWPPPNSSYSAHLFENWDRSKKVVSVIKPFPTSLINIYSWSILGSQSWSYVNFTSSTEFATLKGTNIPVSGLEFSAVENGDFLNIVRVVFNTTTDGWTFPIQWSDIIGYAVFFNTATWQYETQNIKKTSSWTWEVRSEKWWQIVQIVWVPGFSFSHVDLFYWSKYTIKKYECMNNAWECYWSRSATWSFSCGWKINPIYWNEIGSCESVGEYCQPSTNTSTGKLDPFNYLDASGSIRPVYNQSGSISWIAYNSQADDIFSCSYSGLETLLCVPEILWKIWKRFTVALKNLLDFLYSISSISSPKWDWKILWFVNVASAYDAGATLRLPYYTTSTGAKITKETFTWSKNPMSINSSMATMWDNVNNLPDWGIKGIFAFAIYSTILIVLFIVTVMIAVAFSNK